jgi:sorting nexin-29
LHIINQFWLTYEVPEIWKIAEVIPLFKKGDRRECKHYRGISLLNTVYKIYARIVNKRLRTISEALLEEQQNGFRTGRSTTDSIFTLQQVFGKEESLTFKHTLPL